MHCERFHGKEISTQIVRDLVVVESDSCSTGVGIVSGGDWAFLDWQADWPEMADQHINYKEAATVVLAAGRWGPHWEGKHVLFHVDNQAAVGMLNKGSTRDQLMMSLIRGLFWYSVEFNFTFEALYLPGEQNLLADTASHLVRGNLLLQWALLSQIACNISLDIFALTLHQHMPHGSLLLLIPQIQQLGNWRRDSTAE